MLLFTLINNQAELFLSVRSTPRTLRSSTRGALKRPSDLTLTPAKPSKTSKFILFDCRICCATISICIVILILFPRKASQKSAVNTPAVDRTANFFDVRVPSYSTHIESSARLLPPFECIELLFFHSCSLSHLPSFFISTQLDTRTLDELLAEQSESDVDQGFISSEATNLRN